MNFFLKYVAVTAIWLFFALILPIDVVAIIIYAVIIR